MKLSSRQIQALSNAISSKIKEEDKKQKKIFYENLNLTKEQQKEVKVVQEYLDATEMEKKAMAKLTPLLSKYNKPLCSVIAEISKASNAKEAYAKLIYQSKLDKVYPYDIENDLILASIDKNDIQDIDSFIRQYISKLQEKNE